MLTLLRRSKLKVIGGCLAIFMLAFTMLQSYGQVKEPPEEYWQDYSSRMAPGGLGCYTVITLSCPLGIERVHCQFNGVYGPPYDCSWTRCFIGGGDRHCILKEKA